MQHYYECGELDEKKPYLPRSQVLDPIPWSGLQMVPDLT